MASAEAIKRITNDWEQIFEEEDLLAFVFPDDEDITKMMCIIVGPDDTPYEGGFFLFSFVFPPNYPFKPPQVKLVTTDGGKVRFNPNLYANGKVCLSLLGTWEGPQWTPIHSTLSVIQAIQSMIMNPTPYHNEPGYEVESQRGESKKYNDCIVHETLRVAVCSMVEEVLDGKHPDYVEVVEDHFVEKFDRYIDIASEHTDLDGSPFSDPFGELQGTFRFSELKDRLIALKERVDAHIQQREALSEEED